MAARRSRSLLACRCSPALLLAAPRGGCAAAAPRTPRSAWARASSDLAAYRASAPAGVVRFNLTNYGEDAHDLVVRVARRTHARPDGQSASGGARNARAAPAPRHLPARLRPREPRGARHAHDDPRHAMSVARRATRALVGAPRPPHPRASWTEAARPPPLLARRLRRDAAEARALGARRQGRDARLRRRRAARRRAAARPGAARRRPPARPAQRVGPRRPLVARPHGPHDASAAGEADALLARPLRDVRPGHAADARARTACCAATRSAPSARCSATSRATRRCSCSSRSPTRRRTRRTRTTRAS